MSATSQRVGLMGFGRIGRNVFRQLDDHPAIDIVAIADTADPEALTYLLKYDSIYGRFDKPIQLIDGSLDIGGNRIPFIDARAPGDADWAGLGVDIVIQATGKYRTAADCARHLERGAKKVILASTPEPGEDIPIILRGINDEILDANPDIVALGSNTSNALAPALRVIDDAVGVERAFFTTVHGFTNQARLADVPGEGDLRTSRAAGENIIPSPTNSGAILEAVMPEFAGKLAGMALNVPVPDGSTIDLVVDTTRPTAATTINEAMRHAAENRYAGILEYADDPIVSSDVVGSTASGVFDSLATLVMGEHLVKALVWFDNGWGYTARLLEVLERMTLGAEVTT